jgi:hypothetical protein
MARGFVIILLFLGNFSHNNFALQHNHVAEKKKPGRKPGFGNGMIGRRLSVRA